MEEAGASAVVLTSLFEEQLALESHALDEDLSRGTNSYPESLDYLPDLGDYRMTHEGYLDSIRRSKDAVDIPIMASLNGATTGGWVRFAKESEEAGADGIELNTFALATDPSQTSADVERQLLELIESVCRAVKIPVAVKLSQSFTSLPHLVKRLEDAGARGVVLFNRFYQPDFDIETLEVRPTLHFSTPSELLPRLHWAAILHGHVNLDIAITGGVHSAEDVLKCIMAGGNVAMMCSALHIHGIEHIGRVLARPALLAREARVHLARRDARMPQPPLRARHLALRPRQLHQDAQLLQPASDSGGVLANTPCLIFATFLSLGAPGLDFETWDEFNPDWQ